MNRSLPPFLMVCSHHFFRALVSVADELSLQLSATGKGAYDTVSQSFVSNTVNVALLRVTDIVDKHEVLKFVVIYYQPETLAPMKKAKLSAMNKLILNIFKVRVFSFLS